MNQNEKIITNLGRLKLIEPDPVFVKTSKSIILRAEPKVGLFLYFPRFVPLSSILALLLFIIILSFSFFSVSRPALSSSFDSNNLAREFNGLTINIELQEIAYQQKTNQAIASALNEIQDTNVKHLNQSLLESEEDSFNLQNTTDPRIDEMLRSVIF